MVQITGECENFLRDVIRPVSCVQWKQQGLKAG